MQQQDNKYLVGNSEFCSADHIFKIYTLVSEIQDDVDLVLGLKNIDELGGDLSTRDSSLKLLNRSVPLYSKTQTSKSDKS